MELNITLAGANFRPADAKAFIKEGLSRDTECWLVREATNPYDSNAIKIICIDDFGEQIFIGYVPKSDNAVLAQSLDADKPYTITHTGFIGTIQPTFRVEFEPLSIEERNAALDGAEDTDEYENGGTPAAPDDEIPF